MLEVKIITNLSVEWNLNLTESSSLQREVNIPAKEDR
jgi:hypothetical protein